MAKTLGCPLLWHTIGMWGTTDQDPEILFVPKLGLLGVTSHSPEASFIAALPGSLGQGRPRPWGHLYYSLP